MPHLGDNKPDKSKNQPKNQEDEIALEGDQAVPAEAEAPLQEAPPPEGGMIADAESSIAQMAGAGQLGEAAQPMPPGQALSFDSSAIPELADAKPGDPIVFVGAGRITSSTDGQVQAELTELSPVGPAQGGLRPASERLPDVTSREELAALTRPERRS